MMPPYKYKIGDTFTHSTDDFTIIINDISWCGVHFQMSYRNRPSPGPDIILSTQAFEMYLQAYKIDNKYTVNTSEVSKQALKCECGAHTIGNSSKGQGHSHWCPLHEASI